MSKDPFSFGDSDSGSFSAGDVQFTFGDSASQGGDGGGGGGWAAPSEEAGTEEQYSTLAPGEAGGSTGEGGGWESGVMAHQHVGLQYDDAGGTQGGSADVAGGGGGDDAWGGIAFGASPSGAPGAAVTQTQEDAAPDYGPGDGMRIGDVTFDFGVMATGTMPAPPSPPASNPLPGPAVPAAAAAVPLPPTQQTTVVTLPPAYPEYDGGGFGDVGIGLLGQDDDDDVDVDVGLEAGGHVGAGAPMDTQEEEPFPTYDFDAPAEPELVPSSSSEPQQQPQSESEYPGLGTATTRHRKQKGTGRKVVEEDEDEDVMAVDTDADADADAPSYLAAEVVQPQVVHSQVQEDDDEDREDDSHHPQLAFQFPPVLGVSSDDLDVDVVMDGRGSGERQPRRRREEEVIGVGIEDDQEEEEEGEEIIEEIELTPEQKRQRAMEETPGGPVIAAPLRPRDYFHMRLIRPRRPLYHACYETFVELQARMKSVVRDVFGAHQQAEVAEKQVGLPGIIQQRMDVDNDDDLKRKENEHQERFRLELERLRTERLGVKQSLRRGVGLTSESGVVPGGQNLLVLEQRKEKVASDACREYLTLMKEHTDEQRRKLAQSQREDELTIASLRGVSLEMHYLYFVYVVLVRRRDAFVNYLLVSWNNLFLQPATRLVSGRLKQLLSTIPDRSSPPSDETWQLIFQLALKGQLGPVYDALSPYLAAKAVGSQAYRHVLNVLSKQFTPVFFPISGASAESDVGRQRAFRQNFNTWRGYFQSLLSKCSPAFSADPNLIRLFKLFAGDVSTIQQLSQQVAGGSSNGGIAWVNLFIAKLLYVRPLAKKGDLLDIATAHPPTESFSRTLCAILDVATVKSNPMFLMTDILWKHCSPWFMAHVGNLLVLLDYIPRQQPCPFDSRVHIAEFFTTLLSRHLFEERCWKLAFLYLQDGCPIRGRNVCSLMLRRLPQRWEGPFAIPERDVIKAVAYAVASGFDREAAFLRCQLGGRCEARGELVYAIHHYFNANDIDSVKRLSHRVVDEYIAFQLRRFHAPPMQKKFEGLFGRQQQQQQRGEEEQMDEDEGEGEVATTSVPITTTTGDVEMEEERSSSSQQDVPIEATFPERDLRSIGYHLRSSSPAFQRIPILAFIKHFSDFLELHAETKTWADAACLLARMLRIPRLCPKKFVVILLLFAMEMSEGKADKVKLDVFQRSHLELLNSRLSDVLLAHDRGSLHGLAPGMREPGSQAYVVPKFGGERYALLLRTLQMAFIRALAKHVARGPVVM